MVGITDIITRIDTPTTGVTETRIFRLQHADATETSNIINSLYSNASTQQNASANNNAGRFGGFGGFGGPGGGGQTTQSTTRSQRALQEATVVSVPDPRTNSILINAGRDTMEQIALNIGRLDATDSKKQHVYIYALQNADPDNVATILRGMFSGQNSTSTTGAQPSSSMLNQRTQTGASSDVTNTINTGGSSGSSRSSNP
jgi:type II secretory pathway component GspD/PulD (secretin)